MNKGQEHYDLKLIKLREGAVSLPEKGWFKKSIPFIFDRKRKSP